MVIDSNLRWPVHSSGYIVRGLAPGAVGTPVSGAERPRAGQYLVPLSRESQSSEPPSTRHQKAHSPYLAFAGLRWEAAAINEFANAFGLLGRPISATALIGGQLVECEAINLWREEMAAFQQTFRLWNRLSRGEEIDWQLIGSLGYAESMFEECAQKFLPRPRPSALSQRLQREVEKSLRGEKQSNWEDMPPAVAAQVLPVVARISEHYQRTDTVKGAKAIRDPSLFAASYVAKQLTKYAQALMPLRYRWDPSVQCFEAFMRPTTLLGVIWAQFLNSVSANEFRKCLMCQTLIEVSLLNESGNRADRRYCSQKCKQQAYRRRQVSRPKRP